MRTAHWAIGLRRMVRHGHWQHRGTAHWQCCYEKPEARGDHSVALARCHRPRMRLPRRARGTRRARARARQVPLSSTLPALTDPESHRGSALGASLWPVTLTVPGSDAAAPSARRGSRRSRDRHRRRVLPAFGEAVRLVVGIPDFMMCAARPVLRSLARRLGACMPTVPLPFHI